MVTLDHRNTIATPGKPSIFADPKADPPQSSERGRAAAQVAIRPRSWPARTAETRLGTPSFV